MTYQPAAGDRIIVTRTPGNHGRRVGVMTGLVLDISATGFLHFKCDQGGCFYLGTNEQLAAIGRTQTIEPLRDPA
jgi:hypothetical protein